MTGRAKLDKKLGFMVVRSEENIKRVLLDEVSVLIIENWCGIDNRKSYQRACKSQGEIDIL